MYHGKIHNTILKTQQMKPSGSLNFVVWDLTAQEHSLKLSYHGNSFEDFHK